MIDAAAVYKLRVVKQAMTPMSGSLQAASGKEGLADGKDYKCFKEGPRHLTTITARAHYHST